DGADHLAAVKTHVQDGEEAYSHEGEQDLLPGGDAETVRDPLAQAALGGRVLYVPACDGERGCGRGVGQGADQNSSRVRRGFDPGGREAEAGTGRGDLA